MEIKKPALNKMLNLDIFHRNKKNSYCIKKVKDPDINAFGVFQIKEELKEF